MKSIAKRSGIWFGLMGMMVFVLCLGLTVLPASAKKLIKIGHIDSDDPFIAADQAFSVVFKNLVESGTNGEIEVQIFPASVLGKERESMEMLQKGLIQGNVTRSYQVWYRNAANFCQPETFNLSNGVAVTWIP